MSDWYYLAGGAQQGPVDDEALARLAREGTLKRESLVWTDGMPDWRPAAEARSELFPAAPPPRTGAAAHPAAAGAPAGGDVWARLRACESPTGASGRYRGYYQFSQASWHAAGGSGDPAAAPLSEQTARAQYLAAHSNPAQQWPVCWRRAEA